MPSYKLQSTNKNHFGVKLHIPYAEPQVITIDTKGNFEATLANEEELELLLEDCPEFIYPQVAEASFEEKNDTIKPQTEENELGKSEDDKNDIGKPEEESEDDLIGSTNEDVVAMITALDAMKMADMKQLAEDSGYPLEQWGELKRNDLKNYLKEKLSIAA